MWPFKSKKAQVPATQKDLEDLRMEVLYWKTLYEARDLDCEVMEALLKAVQRGFYA